ncbi:DUF1439 domain-containing protein [Xanthomonas euvesicatoria pv. euvesicatoria]|uniref:DUF1439 domain-containing protein n=3 Tax=Xanthomonas euvesicatoria TaxID=456327 RepID=A0A6B3KKQ9_XANEU|nr:DUF1439 domain-containing protein [Xanthomonas euvesicatoria]AOY66515.1 DUF1439 domain-containing protein [Xanthomonas euvesicatoria pv. vesicatoria str. 85-10]APO89908.1 DUF1439 domain-containing protein [Xanthomonas euvesicatoria]KHL61020.1 hypothetical protein XEU66b_13315 [Xanthomonas euvesicatoria]KHL65250.1 hypothetical protein XEU83M_12950 [Xanthomonas euvesicatoria]KLA54139.1 hypothetical protein XEUV683_08430 [Xanthomonas euvesicatoria]
MKLRSLAGSMLALALAMPITSAWAAPQIQGKQISVQASDLRHYLGGRFPQTHDTLGGLIAMTVSNPALSLPPGDRLKMAFDLAVATAGGAPAPVGNVTLTSALRYDVAKQGFYLDQPSIDDFRPAHAGAKLDHSTRQLLNTWLADYARKEPIYRIDPAIASVMGAVQVESVGIQNGRVAVNFNQNIEQLVPAAALSGK